MPLINTNGSINIVHVLGTLQSVSVSDKHFWAVLHQTGTAGGYFPIVAFPPRNGRADQFREELAVLREGDLVFVSGRLGSRKETDDKGAAVLHPVSRRPFSRIEIVVYSIVQMSAHAGDAPPPPSGRSATRSAPPPSGAAGPRSSDATADFPPPPFSFA